MAPPTLVVVRNEVDDEYAFHCDALASYVPGATEVDYPAGERFDLEGVDGVVLSGSTAGVYEADERPWIRDQRRLVRELVDHEIPTLGVCFGHQLVNDALGGTVVHEGMNGRLVEATLAEDPLFEGVEPVVAATHGDVVTDPGDGMDVVGSADYYRAFATRHRTAPLWTVQFHPEYTGDLADRLRSDFEWTDTEHSFDRVNTPRIYDNFVDLADAWVSADATGG